MRKPLLRDSEKPPVGRDPHDRLRHAKRHDLRVCDPPASVPWPLGQEIVRRAINGDEKSVEVGVHVASWSTMPMDTADFGLFSKNPSNTATTVESIRLRWTRVSRVMWVFVVVMVVVVVAGVGRPSRRQRRLSL
jgi:hypothetical protein